MKISEVSKLCNLSIDTIRYYERIGVIKVQKEDYFKNYDSATVEALLAIKKLRFAGLSITEIKKLISIDKEVSALNANDVQTVSEIVDCALSEADDKLRQISEAKGLLEKMKNKLQGLHYGDC